MFTEGKENSKFFYQELKKGLAVQTADEYFINETNFTLGLNTLTNVSLIYLSNLGHVPQAVNAFLDPSARQHFEINGIRSFNELLQSPYNNDWLKSYYEDVKGYVAVKKLGAQVYNAMAFGRSALPTPTPATIFALDYYEQTNEKGYECVHSCSFDIEVI